MTGGEVIECIDAGTGSVLASLPVEFRDLYGENFSG